MYVRENLGECYESFFLANFLFQIAFFKFMFSLEKVWTH